jgi:hypothetical protein
MSNCTRPFRMRAVSHLENIECAADFGLEFDIPEEDDVVEEKGETAEGLEYGAHDVRLARDYQGRPC